jgi:thiamine biosynthesis lipoprotein
MNYFRRIRYLMGAPIEITVEDDSEQHRQAVSAAFSEIARIESLLSIYRPDSEIARFNRSCDRFVPLSAEVRDVLAQALRYAEISDGAFDPTLGPLIRLWGFGPDQMDAPPRPDDIAAGLRCVGFRNLKLFGNGAERLAHGMEINLGGIGKGYALDRAVQRLKTAGISRGLVHCGSTTVAWGDAAWPVAVRHPRRPDDVVGSLPLCNAALSTSGDYERYFIHDGQRYSHLIDPRSGHPTRAAISATVVAESALAADALSTAALIRGESDFLKHLPNTQGWVLRTAIRFAHPPTPFPQPSRRRFLALAASVLVTLLLPWKGQAAVVYMTEEEALSAMMPEADRFDTDARSLSAAQLEQAGTQAGRAFSESAFQFRIGRQGDAVVGYAIALSVIGKERPITFLIGIAPTGAVLGVEVLIYRESEGSEVRHPRFMKQFARKTTADPLRLGRDIQPISGATLSSRAAVHAVRKALALFEVLYKP